MIETTAPIEQAQHQAPRKVLKMVHNERMGGSVPAWETVKTDKQQIEANLSQAANAATSSSEDLLAYSHQGQTSQTNQNAEFGFADLLDMVNPLHHVPVVGYAYREITGDEIKPIGQIIGGAVFGGPIGAAGGLINAIVQQETGDSIEGNAMALAFGGDNEEATPRSNIAPETQPEKRIESAIKAAETNADPQLSNALLAFSPPQQQNIVIERVSAPNSKAAESFEQLRPSAEPVAAREPITQVRFSSRRQYNG